MIKHYNTRINYPICPFIYNPKISHQKINFKNEKITNEDMYDRIDIVFEDSGLSPRKVLNLIKSFETKYNAEYYVITQNINKNTPHQYINFFTTVYSNIYLNEKVLEKPFEASIKYVLIPITYDNTSIITTLKDNTNIYNNIKNIIKNKEEQQHDNVEKHDKIEKYDVNKRNMVNNRRKRFNLSKLHAKKNQYDDDLIVNRIKVDRNMGGVKKIINGEKMKLKSENIEIKKINGRVIFSPSKSGKIYIENPRNELMFLSILRHNTKITITLHKISYHEY
jgi:hypothetical protein